MYDLCTLATMAEEEEEEEDGCVLCC